MNKLFLRICSLLIAIVMIINVMPINVVATEVQGNMSVSTEEVDSVSVEDTYIIDEIISRRTEYTKEFKLSNGLNMTTVYADAVHYDNDGTWADIDNTLCLSNGVYTNTAGVWDVNLPQQMGSSTPVSISKDGYVLSFYLAGELHSNLSDVEVASTNILDNYSVQNLQFAAAQVLEADSLIQNDQYPEITSNKLYSTFSVQ